MGAVLSTGVDCVTGEAFGLMLRHQRRCVLLVDESGGAVEVLSLSDVRWLAGVCDVAGALELRAVDYLGKAEWRPGEVIHLVSSSGGRCEFVAVLRLMVTHDVHQVFVLDASGAAIGMVDSEQMLRALMD